MTSKVCRQCNAAKTAYSFSRHPTTTDKLQPNCKECCSAYMKTWRKSKPAIDGDRHVTPERRAYHLVRTAKNRAADKGWGFDLTPEWALEKLKAGTCEATGIPFHMVTGDGTGNARPFSPSLDRKDNSLGYTKDNCHVVCWMYNAAKGTASHADVVRFAEALCATR